MSTHKAVPFERKIGKLFLKDRPWFTAVFFLLLLGILLLCGCGPKKVQNTEVSQPMNPVTASATPIPMGSYAVEKGDTLWGIAGKNSIYGDSFQWPLLFKTNRDMIQDPDLIYPKQVFAVDRNVSADEKSVAIKEASDTPPFKSHPKARHKLPVDYF